MKQMMLIVATALLTMSLATSVALAESSEVKAAQSKIAKWESSFLNHCQNQFERASNKKNSKEYCLCIMKEHRDYIINKIESKEEIDVDQHLQDLSAIYQKAPLKDDTDGAEDDAPSIVDLDIDIAASCLAKHKPAKPQKVPQKAPKKQ